MVLTKHFYLWWSLCTVFHWKWDSFEGKMIRMAFISPVGTHLRHLRPNIVLLTHFRLKTVASCAISVFGWTTTTNSEVSVVKYEKLRTNLLQIGLSWPEISRFVVCPKNKTRKNYDKWQMYFISNVACQCYGPVWR